MNVTYLDGLPGLATDDGPITIRVVRSAAFVFSPHFVASIDLQRANINWLIERRHAIRNPNVWKFPRYINAHSRNEWVDVDTRVLAEISGTEGGELLVSARNMDSGALLWDHVVPIPSAAPWAETRPAWRGAQTEEIYGFVADDLKRLVVCLFRESRRSMCSSPSEGIEVMSLPPYHCQLDCVRFDPRRGTVLWQESFIGVHVGILERQAFSGLWSNGGKMGALDLEVGENRVLHESPCVFGPPIRLDSSIVVSWRGKGAVGVDWLDDRNGIIKSWKTKQPRITSTRLHSTDAGVALQANDQAVWWLGGAEAPLWNTRAKPYIYHVFGAPESDIFVGTDGAGGRLFAYDPVTGVETLNIKPSYGGAGSMKKVPNRDVLFAKFWTSKKDASKCELMSVSMRGRKCEGVIQCRELLGTWEHGAICQAGLEGERLAIVDIRNAGED